MHSKGVPFLVVGGLKVPKIAKSATKMHGKMKMVAQIVGKLIKVYQI
jgi:hypothetical protein